MDKPPAISSLSRKGTWRTYTTAEGLAGLQTEHIAEDAEGYLWIGTWAGGGSRFDGDEFRTFTTKDGLPGNRVQAILLDRQGRLWFGTDRGVALYDGQTFQAIQSKDLNSVTDILISADHLLALINDILDLSRVRVGSSCPWRTPALASLPRTCPTSSRSSASRGAGGARGRSRAQAWVWRLRRDRWSCWGGVFRWKASWEEGRSSLFD